MTKEELYWLEKHEERFRIFKQGKYQIKVRVAVVKNGKIVVLKNVKNNKVIYSMPGGSKDEGETQKQAVVREVLEEVNTVCKPVEYVGKIYTSRKTKFKDQEFVSKRIEYFYIAEFIKDGNNSIGIEGEFVGDVTVTELDLSEFAKIKVGEESKKMYRLTAEKLKKHV